jgi:transcription initiation factor TFIIE subunit alpha
MLVAVRKKTKTPKSKNAGKKDAIRKAKPVRQPVKEARKAKKPLKAKVPVEPVPKKDELEKETLRRVGKILGDSNVRQNLIEIGGENALAIVRNFYGNHSDEELAKKLKIKISDVRATLNKLHNEGLVNYIREKDSETGWYSYSWSLNHQRMEKWAVNHAGRLNPMGTESGEDYYFCPACGSSSITNFESAATCEFRCERCNRMLEFIDEKKMNELYEKSKG